MDPNNYIKVKFYHELNIFLIFNPIFENLRGNYEKKQTSNKMGDDR